MKLVAELHRRTTNDNDKYLLIKTLSCYFVYSVVHEIKYVLYIIYMLYLRMHPLPTYNLVDARPSLCAMYRNVKECDVVSETSWGRRNFGIEKESF